MNKICIITNTNKDVDFNFTNKIIEKIKNYGFEYISFDSLEKSKIDLENIGSCDFAFVLGGDGTVLETSKYLSKLKIPIVSVNLGRVGFLANISIDEIDDILKSLKSGNYIIEKRMMIVCNYEKSNVNALNEIVLSRGNSNRIINIGIYIDNIEIDEFRADGVIISTPTGSTAYSLSAGGPVVEPDLQVIAITPICAHNLYSRPIIVSSDKNIKIVANNDFNEDIYVSADGNDYFNIKNGADVFITKSQYTCNFIKYEQKGFFNILKDKLSNKRG